MLIVSEMILQYIFLTYKTYIKPITLNKWQISNKLIYLNKLSSKIHMHLLIKPNQVYLATIWKMSEFKDLWINMISKKNMF